MDAEEWLDYIRKNCPQISIGGEVHYVVERDLLVPGNRLQRYAESLAAGIAADPPGAGEADRLVAATTTEGKMMRWAPGTVLTWGFDRGSFKGEKDFLKQALSFCAKAAADWNDAATDRKIADRISFAPAPFGKKPVFRFAFHRFPPEQNLLALAFYPNAAPAERTVYIGPNTFRKDLPYDQAGIIRHELGHVLGFRHEHIRPEAHEGMTPPEIAKMEKWVAGGMGAEELNEFDRQSVMMYPQFGNGDGTFRLSAADKAGFGILYSAPSEPAKIQDFHV